MRKSQIDVDVDVDIDACQLKAMCSENLEKMLIFTLMHEVCELISRCIAYCLHLSTFVKSPR